MRAPASASAAWRRVARAPAGLRASSGEAQRRTISAAPSSVAATSMPAAAAGKSPTGERTENRPPTSSGTGNVGRSSSADSSRRGPALPVVTRTRRRAPSGPRASSRRCHATRKLAAVSAVSPDLLTTLKRVRSRSRASRRAPNVSGSRLSSTWRRGRPSAAAAPAPVHVGGRRASRRAAAPSAEPPIPTTTTASHQERRDAAALRLRSARSHAAARAPARAKNPISPAARRASVSSKARRKRRARSPFGWRRSGAKPPRGRTPASMLP